MAYSGFFKPKHPKKYKGDPTKIVYRSLWEKTFFKWCDETSSVIEWASEEIVVPYLSPITGRRHRYFPDVWIKYIDKDGKTKEKLIEIKPEKETVPPKEPKRRTKRFVEAVKTYATNQAKWSAAREACANRGIEFVILTERHLVPGGKKHPKTDS